MSIALNAGVSGLKAFQTMLDVSGNNIANLDTTAYKSSNVTFAELYSQTISSASGATANTGGTNSVQVGTGVGLASISNNVTQGDISSTNNNLDCAIDGEGYFVVNDGGQDLYTRAGTFTVDEDGYMVDSTTGYRVQRTGETGEAQGFQTVGSSDIVIPYDSIIEPNATSSVTMSGNLSKSDTLETTQTQVLGSNYTFTTDGSTAATASTTLGALYNASTSSTSGTWENCTFTINGIDRDTGSAITTHTISTLDSTDTVQDLLDEIETAFGTDVTATMSNGKIIVTDNTSGYSLLDVDIAFSHATATLDMPAYFEITTVGGEEVQSTSISVYDSAGEEYTLSGAYVRTDTANSWDFVITSVVATNGTEVYDLAMGDTRRVSGLTFSATDGSYAGTTDTESITIAFTSDISAAITLDFGSEGSFDGLTQVAGESTAVASDQDGYASGSLSSVAIDSSGNIVGTFSNGAKLNIATLQLAIFNNPSGLDRVSQNLYTTSANSGIAIETSAGVGGAGNVKGSSLEGSNVELADEYVTLIQAQNGYQANARTIQVANDVLKELTNLIR